MRLEGAEEEELEARRILTKRKRRVNKIEDINIDIDALFASKKRFKPDDSTCESTMTLSQTPSATHNPDLQLKLAKQSF